LYFTTSTWIRRIFWFGDAEGGIQKMRSKFFEKSKSSAVAGTLPAGSGGKSSIFNNIAKRTKRI
jgi:hypothetical protein